MKRTWGFGLMLVGLASAALFAARTAGGESPAQRVNDWWSHAGLPFCGAMLMMIAGALLLRSASQSRQGKPSASGAKTGSSHPDSSAVTDFDAIVQALEGLPDAIASNSAELHTLLDDLLEERIPRFLEHREHLIEELGLLHFSRFMGPFASFERNAARAWSALTDGAHEEMQLSLQQARTALSSAGKELREP